MSLPTLVVTRRTLILKSWREVVPELKTSVEELEGAFQTFCGPHLDTRNEEMMERPLEMILGEDNAREVRSILRVQVSYRLVN